MNRAALRALSLGLMLGLHFLLDAYAERLEAAELRAEDLAEDVEDLVEELEQAPRDVDDLDDLSGPDFAIFAVATMCPECAAALADGYDVPHCGCAAELRDEVHGQ